MEVYLPKREKLLSKTTLKLSIFAERGMKIRWAMSCLTEKRFLHVSRGYYTQMFRKRWIKALFILLWKHGSQSSFKQNEKNGFSVSTVGKAYIRFHKSISVYSSLHEKIKCCHIVEVRRKWVLDLEDDRKLGLLWQMLIRMQANKHASKLFWEAGKIYITTRAI